MLTPPIDRVDGTPPPGKGPGEPATPHSNRSIVFGGEGVYIPFPSHNFVSYLGPEVYILLLDCRAERKKTQVCSQATYGAVFKACEALPATVKHLVILLGVPVRNNDYLRSRKQGLTDKRLARSHTLVW